MKKNFAIFVTALAVPAVLIPPLGAQWLNYPTPGIPRTAGGKPNLTAPAPRTAAAKPDLSGVWQMEDRRPCLPDCENSQSADEFLNIARSLKGGLPYQPGAAALAKARRQSPKTDEPITNCLPIGIVERYTHVTLRKIVEVPGLVLILNEYNKMYRQIPT